MEQIVFRGVISSAGSDKYGERRYAIYIPKDVKEKAEDRWQGGDRNCYPARRRGVSW
ncbi:hypothetical protein [Acidilobus sp.]|uniref:hypothetical protein n=1 Tax=Acidilobus sp. TaxID=1872109 RepID=UPI003CFE702B